MQKKWAAATAAAARGITMAEPDVYLEKLSAFSRMLHLENLSVSPKETEDAARLLIALGMDDRERVKTALRTVYAKSREEQITFDRVFDGFFLSEEQIRRQAKEQMEREQELAQHRREAEEELQLNGQPMDLSEKQRETYAAMPEEARQRLRGFMEKYRGTAERNPKLYGDFIHSVFTRAIMEQQMLMENAGVGGQEMDPEIGILYRDISQFKDTEIPKAIELIQAVAREINGELAAKGHSGGHMGKLDFRRHHPQGTGNRRQLLPPALPEEARQTEASGAAVRCVRLHGAVFGICPAVHPEPEPGLGKLPGISVLRNGGGSGRLPAAEYGPVPQLRKGFRDLRPGYGLGRSTGDSVCHASKRAGGVRDAAHPLRHQNHRPAPGGRGGAGGKASGGTGDLPEPYPGGEVAVYQKRSDHGVHLPHGIVQHPAGAGLGLPQTDKGNVNKLTALRAVGASGRKLPDGFDGWS